MGRLDEIDWEGWAPTDRATLVFVHTAPRLLLIRKKRGLGAGKINGPGGRVEPGETLEACAVRELQEELHITPRKLACLGDLRFQFVDGYSIHVAAFRALAFDGEPTETDEAAPVWVDTAAVPYQEMWEDDRIWLPRLLRGEAFAGRFVFDDDVMLDHSIDR